MKEACVQTYGSLRNSSRHKQLNKSSYSPLSQKISDKGGDVYIQKKRGSLYLSLVPRNQAFALPFPEDKQHLETHADMRA